MAKTHEYHLYQFDIVGFSFSQNKLSVFVYITLYIYFFSNKLIMKYYNYLKSEIFIKNLRQLFFSFLINNCKIVNLAHLLKPTTLQLNNI